jgi:hypothetical protein
MFAHIPAISFARFAWMSGEITGGSQLGFDVRVSGHWGGASGRRVLRVANGLLSRMSRLTIYSARGFVIAAKKT